MAEQDLLSVGNLQVAPGDVGFGHIEGIYLQDSSLVNIPIIVMRGKTDGPILWIDSTMHGPEIPGAEVIRRLMRETLDPADLRGAVIAAPILNPLAFRAQEMNTPQDGYNLNRVFPGSPQGLTSQRLAARILNDGVLRADAAINFHANPQPAIPFAIIGGADDSTAQRQQQMADAFGITTIRTRISNEPHRTGTLSGTAGAAGKPVLVIELIPWRRFDEAGITVGLRGTLNVLRHLGMLDGAIEPQTDTIVIPGPLTRTEVTTNKGGLAYPLKDAGDAVRAGETILLLRNPYGDVVEEVRSPVDGWVLAFPFMLNQSAVTGDFVAFIAYRL